MVKDIPYDSSRYDVVFEGYKALKVFISLKRIGLNLLRNKNYQKAIEEFTIFIEKYEAYNYYELNYLDFFKWIQDDIYEIYLFRSFTFSLLKNFDNANADFSTLMTSDCEWTYPYFILFTWKVLENNTNDAIKYYYKFRECSKEFKHFEKDLLTHLPINKTLGKTIELINCSFGISS